MKDLYVSVEHNYNKQEVQTRMEELSEASFLFVAGRDKDLYFAIVGNLMNEEHRRRYKLDMWKDMSQDGKFRDLVTLGILWAELASMTRADAQTDPIVGSTQMQRIANLTAKLRNHRYGV